MTWLRRIAAPRLRVEGAEPEELERAPIDAADFADAIAETAAMFEPFRAAQLERVLDRFCASIGRRLEKLEPKERARASAIAVSTMRSLMLEVGAVPELMAAMATLSSMLDPRGLLDVDPETHARSAKSAMSETLAAIEGRYGATSMLHAHRHALELIELASPSLRASDRPALWKAASDLIADALPRPGADFVKTARLISILSAALKQHPRDPRAALDATRCAVFAEQQAAQESARRKIAELPPHLGSLAAALSRALDANPAGPPEIATAVESLAERARDRGGAESAEDLARVIDLVADTPAVRAVLDHLLWSFPSSAKVTDPNEVPLALVRARWPDAPVSSWKAVPRAAALRSALALMDHVQDRTIATALASEIVHVAPSLPRMEDLTRFAHRFAAAHPYFAGVLEPADAAKAASAFATPPGEVDANAAVRAAGMCHIARTVLKDVPLERMVDGIMKLADASQFVRDPQPILEPLLRAIAGAPVSAEARAPLVRHALRCAGELAKLDRDPQQTDLPLVVADWTAAIAAPGRLSQMPGPQKVVALRAPKSIPAFLDAHPKLPIEVAVTAGMHLSPEQLGWLHERSRASRSHADVRTLRDVVFAAVALDRIDLIEALKSSKSTAKAIAGAAAMIAQHHRLQRLGELPIDRIIEGLAKGEDPASAIAKERAAGALAPQLESVQREITDLLAFLPAVGRVHEVDTARFRDPLVRAIEATAAGTWPHEKFHGEVADRHLADLSPRAREIWEQESITHANGAEVDGPALTEAMHLVRGLKRVLPAEWDRAMLDALTKERAERIEALHATERGSEQHRILSRALRPLSQQIAMVELELAIERVLAQGADAATALLELGPFLAAAYGPSKTIAGPGIASAIQRIASSARGIRRPGREGLYAVDESRLEAYLTAFGGSCVHPSTGRYRAALVELIVGSQYKVGRIMDGDKPLGRTILRLLKIELPGGYRGYGLRMDKPLLTTTWHTSPPDDQMRLMFRHALDKAMAMGVPLLVSQPELIRDHAALLGCEVVEDAPVKLWIDKGHTALHHNQGMFADDYFIAWPELSLGQTIVRPNQPEDLEVERNYRMTIVVPPKDRH